ncbi:MAG: phosphotransferase [Phycisphaerales bacterium]
MDLLLIEQLAHLEVADDSSERLELDDPRLALRRAWPRSHGHLLLEYIDGQGRIVPGQWMQDVQQLKRVADETAKCCPNLTPVVVVSDAGPILLQPRGADRRLVGLRALLARPGSTLLSHRPERRAVVRLEGSPDRRFAKVVRPSRVRAVSNVARDLSTSPDRPFTVPEVIEVDERQGVVIFSALAGIGLDALFSDRERLVPAARATGGALRWLHDKAPRPQKTHNAQAEIGVLQKWLTRVEAFALTRCDRLHEAAAKVFKALNADACHLTMIHRDFYEKQIVIGSDGQVGILDFDTAAAGEPALDVANLFAHLELRVLQGRCSLSSASQATDALLEGYDPRSEVLARLPAYRDASRLRLACVYAFRPRCSHLVTELVRRIELPHLYDVRKASRDQCIEVKYPT